MAIQYFEQEKIIMLQGKETTYAIGFTDKGSVCNLHWGGKLNCVEDVPKMTDLMQRHTMLGRKVGAAEFQEYRGWGGQSVQEPGVKITFPDGTRNLFLKYISHEINGETLKIVTKDTQYPVQVTLIYNVKPEFDIIERYTEIENLGDENFNIEIAASANWHLPARKNYRLTYFTGNYGHEFQLNREKLGSAKRVLESRRGLSGFDCVPFFMVDGGEATEDHGDVYFGSVIWSGNWKIIVDRDCNDLVTITGGFNDFDFTYCLEPGQKLETARFFAGYLPNGGFGGVSRRMHRYERAEIIHPMERDRVLPIIYNTHNSFYNRVDENIILGEIEHAHEVGIELFVLEGGWTGWGELDCPDNDYHSHRMGYGSWEVNEKRFPSGLKRIGDKLHSYGMKFGLWIEPEAVFYTNKVALEHPDWIVGYNNREAEIAGMNCYVLDMANDEACEYITNVLIKIIGENGIDYIKNDFNRAIPHMGFRSASLEHKKEGWVRYVRNMWKCYRTVKEHFPNLIFENSASGGKRTDLGMLQIAGRMHRSDNQDPLDAVTMYDAMAYFIPPKFQGGACFVSGAYSQWFNERPATIEYQGNMGMLSSLSISMGLQEVPKHYIPEIKRIIELDKKIRDVVQLGDMYRIVSVLNNPYGVYQYVNYEQSKSVVFIMGQNMQFAEMPDRARMKGLKPDAKYKVTGYGSYYKKPFCRYEPTQPYYYEEIPERTKDYGTFSGNALMNSGLPIWVKGTARSEILVLEEI